MPETLFSIDEATRTARGLLVPYGEMTNERHKYPAVFSSGTVTVPANLGILRANREHALTDPVATFSAVEDTAAGIVATFAIEDGEDGDALIAAHKRGELTHLSAEFKRLVKRGAEVVSGVLTGAAFTSTPAFTSAGLFSLDPVEEQPAEDEGDEPAETTDGAPAPEDHEPATEPEKEATAMPAATVPNTAAGKPSATPAAEPTSAESVFSLIHRAVTQRDTDEGREAARKLAEEHGDALFALTDVKISGSNQVGTGVIQPQWLGELWNGKKYDQKFLPCFGAPGALTSPILTGWKWTTPPTVATWTGNKSDIPSGTMATGSSAGVMQRFAAGHDLAREFYDFAAGAEVVASYIRALVESYAKVSDLWFRDQIITLAGAGTNYDATGVPTGVSASWAKIVQGALSVIASDNTPSFAWVAPDVFKEIILTRSIDSSEYLSSAFDFEGGNVSGFRVIPTTALSAGKVLVGAKEAVDTFQLPGSPIRVNALDVARGGVDEAVFGYLGYIDADSVDGLELVKNAA